MGSIRPTVRRKESGEINRGLDYLFNKQEQQCPRCMTAFWQLALRDTLAMLPQSRDSLSKPTISHTTVLQRGCLKALSTRRLLVCTRRWCSRTAAPRAAQAPSPASQRKWLPTPLRTPAANCSQLRVPQIWLITPAAHLPRGRGCCMPPTLLPLKWTHSFLSRPTTSALILAFHFLLLTLSRLNSLPGSTLTSGLQPNKYTLHFGTSSIAIPSSPSLDTSKPRTSPPYPNLGPLTIPSLLMMAAPSVVTKLKNLRIIFDPLPFFIPICNQR